MDEDTPDDDPRDDDAVPDALPPAVADLYQTMGRECLPSPPIPRPLREHVRSRGDLQWGTEPIDPMEHYMFRTCWQDLVADGRDDPVFTFSHFGHGINSYFFTLRLRVGPLAAAMQCHWSPYPIYANRTDDVTKMARQFMHMRILLDGIVRQQGPPRWLLLSSTSRGVAELVDVAQLLNDNRPTAPRDMPGIAGGEDGPQRRHRLVLPSRPAAGGPLPPPHEDEIFVAAAEALGVEFDAPL